MWLEEQWKKRSANWVLLELIILECNVRKSVPLKQPSGWCHMRQRRILTRLLNTENSRTQWRWERTLRWLCANEAVKIRLALTHISQRYIRAKVPVDTQWPLWSLTELSPDVLVGLWQRSQWKSANRKDTLFSYNVRTWSFWAISFGPFFMKFTHNGKSNRHFQIMSKTEKMTKMEFSSDSSDMYYIYEAAFTVCPNICRHLLIEHSFWN